MHLSLHVLLRLRPTFTAPKPGGSVGPWGAPDGDTGGPGHLKEVRGRVCPLTASPWAATYTCSFTYLLSHAGPGPAGQTPARLAGGRRRQNLVRPHLRDPKVTLALGHRGQQEEPWSHQSLGKRAMVLGARAGMLRSTSYEFVFK